MDVLATRAPSILVPFAQDGETEQTVRAKLLARHPGFQFISEAELTPARLAATVDAVVDAPPSPKNPLRTSLPYNPHHFQGAFTPQRHLTA